MKYAKKSLGQNFLKDKNIINKILNQRDVYAKNIIEIGPGQGALTDCILKKKPKSLILIEKDNNLYEDLKLKYKNNKKIKIFNDDILKFNLEKVAKKNSIIFGNLPFNISSQILVKIIKFKKWPPNYVAIILMFQKEMADRIIAKFGSSEYGRLSILTNYKLKLINRFNISPNCFSPKPKVTSTILYLEPKLQNKYKIRNIENLEKITKFFFSSKRKMINKSINKIFKNSSQKQVIHNIDLSLRPSDLNFEKYYKITKLFEEVS